jgi:hypothetical protein
MGVVSARTRRWARPALGAACLLAACAPAARPPGASSSGGAPSILRAARDPTVQGSRVLPEAFDLESAVGAEAEGGLRFLVGGVRLLRSPGGGVRASEQRFPESSTGFVAGGSQAAPSYALPPRLGGGFLFVVEPTLYRSDSWLSNARPVYTSSSQIADVVLGLDRVYVRAPNGSQTALDPRTGGPMDPGPWPRAPTVVAYRALDGWVAGAVADLRAAIATFDAGATWKALPLPLSPKSVEIARTDPATGEAFLVPVGSGTAGDFLVFRGTEPLRKGDICYAVRKDETVTRLPSCPRVEPADAALVPKDTSVGRLFGPRPLLAAVEDGWPVDPDTALVARDGALGRVRLSDGVWIAVNPDAFPSKPARCHPMPVLVDDGAPGLGFACVEPRGRTILFLYDARGFALVPVRAFERARPVLAFGNGAVAVGGGCDGEGEPRELRYCVLSREPAKRTPRWMEVALAPVSEPRDGGDDARIPTVDSRRLLVFDDGRVAVLSPPSGKLSAAEVPGVPGASGAPRMTFMGEADSSAKELDLGEVSPDVERELQSGVWLDGFEEREPGVASGWVESSGSMLGVQVAENGQVRVGAAIRDAGSPIVSGRYGLGWSPAHRAYETTDGGMTWNTFDVPRPLSTAPGERACGPVGCTAAGWVRVGWGKATPSPVETLEAVRSVVRSPPELDLVCDPQSAGTRSAQAAVGPPSEREDFYGVPPPARRPDDAKILVDVMDTTDSAPRSGPLARIYAWGPHSDDWGGLGRWVVRWLSPFSSSRDVRTTPSAPTPYNSVEAARRALAQLGSGGVVNWSMAVGDDPSSALLIGRRPGPDVTVLMLEAERNPVEVRRADGEPFAEVYAATRAGGQWYIVTQQAYGEAPASVVLRIEGSEAREYARAPRMSFELRPSPPHLARRSDGRGIGLVVDGQPSPDRRIPLRWVLPLDPETAQAEPESLGAADLGDRGKLPPCSEGDVGWTLDTSWAGRVRIVSSGTNGIVTKLYIRARLSSEKACLEQVSGSLELSHPTPASPQGGPSSIALAGSAGLDPGSSLRVSVLQNGVRMLLQCRPR